MRKKKGKIINRWFDNLELEQSPVKHLKWAIENQPDLPFHSKLELTSPVLLLKHLRSFLRHSERKPRFFAFHKSEVDRFIKQEEQSSEIYAWKDMITNAITAAKSGESLKRILAGKYIVEPWGWEDSHIFWGEKERTCNILKWIFTNK